MNHQLSILGCGWLGVPLAKHFIKQGWKVKGSTTQKSKLTELDSEDIIPYLIKLEENHILGNIVEFLEGSDHLIVDVPPGLRRHPESDYIAKLRPLLKAVEESNISQVLFISSTGVFQDHESLPSYTEHYRFTPQEIKNNQLIQAEQLFQNSKVIQTSILRFGGLIGNDRHPVKYLSGKTDVKNPNSPVNLIHLEHCILLISEIIQQEKFGMVFHGVEDIKLSKKDYYTQKAKELDLPIPGFNHETNSIGKDISMEWTSRKLGVHMTKKSACDC